MLGFLITALFSLGVCGWGQAVAGRRLASLDPALAWGLRGLIGLGVVGWISLPIGLAPGGVRWGLGVVAALAISGYSLLFASRKTISSPIQLPKGWPLLALGLATLALLFSLVGVLGPSDTLDWDSLAYHLAVPKLWIQAGQIEFVPTIHHSNFPFLVDNLFLWGLQWGGEAGAKAFVWAYSFWGGLAMFGFARGRYGPTAGWIALAAFWAIPSVLWESGTAYIDAAHGTWSALGVLFAAAWIAEESNKDALWLSGLCLGFAASSKYTGLQVALAVGIVLAIWCLARRQPKRAFASGSLLPLAALALASPWLIRNAATTGNPVYPFFYSVFGGENWDGRRSAIYEAEQKSFGKTGASPLELPHAILGLAYQPGRYVNPAQTEGGGFPFGALGVVPLIALLGWPLSGRTSSFEGGVLAAVFVCFLFWFFLSQQSRYALNMGLPLTLLAAGGVVRLRAGPLLAGAISLQALYSLWLMKTVTVDPKLPVVLGNHSAEDYRKSTVALAAASPKINELAQESKVALYDEVFGFLLDVPYFWANPGHSTWIPYDEMRSGQDLARWMGENNVGFAYYSFALKPQSDVQAWLATAGLAGPETQGYSDEEIQGLLDNFELRWKALLADAVRTGALRPVWTGPSGVLLERSSQ